MLIPLALAGIGFVWYKEKKKAAAAQSAVVSIDVYRARTVNGADLVANKALPTPVVAESDWTVVPPPALTNSDANPSTAPSREAATRNAADVQGFFDRFGSKSNGDQFFGVATPVTDKSKQQERELRGKV